MQQTAHSIVKKLQEAGYTAYLVGGCVRDLILKQEPKDYDIATNALPEQIEMLFEKSFAIGKQFGVILIEENNHHFEIATFRSDSGYSDGRRPDAVIFSSAEEDAKRRDFTINGIFYDPISTESPLSVGELGGSSEQNNHNYIDYVGGISDLKRELLRFIGEPNERIKEDFLRILRAVRFKNRFGLSYHHDTEEALKFHNSLVTQVAAERIQQELTTMLMHPQRKAALMDLKQLGILKKLIPEIDILESIPQSPDHHSEGNVWNHILLVMDNFQFEKTDHITMWAALFHDLGKAEAVEKKGERIRFLGHQKISSKLASKICKRLKFSKRDTESIIWIVRHHHIFDQWNNMKLITKLQYFDHPDFRRLCNVHHADLLGSIATSQKGKKAALQELNLIQENHNYAEANHMLPSQQNELLSGQEIMEFTDLKPGKKVGEIKQQLRELQIEGEIKNKKEAIAWLKKMP